MTPFLDDVGWIKREYQIKKCKILKKIQLMPL